MSLDRPAPEICFLREAQIVPHMIPISPATLWRLVREGHFPKPVKLASRITAWRAEDVRAWMNSRCEARIEEAGPAE